MIQEYCLGFLYNDSASRVVLIKKQTPAWQKDKLNGVGGKLMPDEISVEAMVREFQEETGAKTRTVDWRKFAVMTGDLFKVHCFCAFNNAYMAAIRSTTKELVDSYAIVLVSSFPRIDNLDMLVAIGADQSGVRNIVELNY